MPYSNPFIGPARTNAITNMYIAPILQAAELRAKQRMAQQEMFNQLLQKGIGYATESALLSQRGQQDRALSQEDWARRLELEEIQSLTAINNALDRNITMRTKATAQPALFGADTAIGDVTQFGIPGVTAETEDSSRGLTPYQIAKSREYADRIARIQSSQSLTYRERLAALAQEKQNWLAAIQPIAGQIPKPKTGQEVAQTSMFQLPDGTVGLFDARGVPHFVPRSPANDPVKQAELQIKAAQAEADIRNKEASAFKNMQQGIVTTRPVSKPADENKELRAWAADFLKNNPGSTAYDAVRVYDELRKAQDEIAVYRSLSPEQRAQIAESVKPKVDQAYQDWAVREKALTNKEVPWNPTRYEQIAEGIRARAAAEMMRQQTQPQPAMPSQPAGGIPGQAAPSGKPSEVIQAEAVLKQAKAKYGTLQNALQSADAQIVSQAAEIINNYRRQIGQ